MIEPPFDGLELLPLLLVLNESFGRLAAFGLACVWDTVALQISQKALGAGDAHALGFLIEHKAVVIQRSVLFKSLNFDGEVFAFEAAIPFFDFLLKPFRVYRAFVDIKEGHVVVEDLV